MRQLIDEFIGPFFTQGVRRAFFYFIRARLVSECHHEVAVEHAVSHFIIQRDGIFESGVFFYSGKAEGDDGDVLHTGCDECFTHE